MAQSERPEPQPPEGVFPFFMSDKNAEKHVLKTGTDIADLCEGRCFATENLLKDVRKYGFMSAFEPVKERLKDCGLEEVIVACDPKSRYGEMFLLLHNQDAIQRFNEEQREKKRVICSSRDKDIAAASIPTKQDKPVYVDVPLLPRPYQSESMTETDAEIAEFSVHQERPLLEVEIVQPRHMLARDLHLTDASERIALIPPEEMAGCGHKRIERDVAIQAIPKITNGSAQTTWNRKVDKTIQYQPVQLSDFGNSLGNIMNSSDICNFLRRVLFMVECALQEESVDIFSDILLVPERDDLMHTQRNHQDDVQLKELRNFTDLQYSKGKALNCVNWHPQEKDILAASAITCPTGTMRDGHIIVWKFGIQLHPLAVLRAPMECPTFRFNPTNPNMIVGGQRNGQVVLWEMSCKAEPAKDDPPINPVALSHPEYSHKRMVNDIIWLPADTQVNAKGKLLARDHLTSDSHQFITVSGDGYALFWDTRFEEIMTGKYPHIAKPKPSRNSQNQMQLNHDAAVSETLRGNDFPSLRWAPIFRIKIKRIEGTGERNISHRHPPRLKFICASEENDVLAVNWLPTKQNNDDNDEIASPDYVEWMKPSHRPSVALAASPFFPDYIMTVADWNFSIWKTDKDSKYPVFISPNASTHLTGGQWSPTRPCTLFLSRADGCIDIWDFSDTSYGPSSTLSLIPSKITSMEFLIVDDTECHDPQLLAVGDGQGSLHVFELSINMSRPLPKERSTMELFLDREMRLQNQAIEQASREANGEALESEDTNPTMGAESKDTSTAMRPDTEEGSVANEGLTEEEENSYAELERKCIEELGLSIGCK